MLDHRLPALKILMTIADCLKRVYELDTETARLDLEVLLAWALKKDRAYLYTWPEKNLSSDQQNVFDTAVERRKKGEPIAYIVGEKEFWSLPLYVDDSTLIPRADTEILVEAALEKITAPMKILDLGTGTGAIAIALANERPACQLMAVDKSIHALALAHKNRERHGLSNLVFMCSDWFSNIQEKDFDIIVSNPPYVDANDPHLVDGDVIYEPQSALVAAEKGLADIKKITGTSVDFLKQGGWLMIEHGWEQASDVREVFTRENFSEITTMQDYAGNDRVTMGRSNGKMGYGKMGPEKMEESVNGR